MIRKAADYHGVLEKLRPRPEPGFEDPEMQVRVWGRCWGVHDDVGPLHLAMLRRPGEEIQVMDTGHYDPSLGVLINEEEQWYFRSAAAPDLALMQRQHDMLAAALVREGVEVVYLEECPPHDPKAMFVRDVAIAIRGGVIIGRMGTVGKKGGRRGEEACATRRLAEMGVPILHTIHGRGLLEGGSFAFIDQHHAVLGMSYRQNEDGARQLEAVLSTQGVDLIHVPLTGHSLHLDGAFVMVDRGLALVDITRLPYWFLDELASLGVKTVQVHPDDDWYAINCLAIGPGRTLMSRGGERTAERLARHGVQVAFVEYDEIHKNGGGIHCSTLPLIREKV